MVCLALDLVHKSPTDDAKRINALTHAVLNKSVTEELLPHA
jgi:hypothetical protein